MASSFRWILFACCWLLTFSLPGRADTVLHLSANDRFYNPAAHAAYLIDDASTLTLDALPTDPAAWQPVPADSLNLGYLTGAVWLKWQFQRSADMPPVWYLLLQYPMLDQIDVYLRPAGTRAEPMHVALGDRLPFAQRPLRHPDFVVPLNLDSGVVYDLFIRVLSKGSLQVPVSMVAPEHFLQEDRIRTLLEGGSYFTCLIMALYNFMLFLFLRDKSYFFYVSYILMFVVALGANRGWGFEFLWPESPRVQEWAIVLGTLFAIASACAFATSFMRLSQLAPLLHRIISGLAIACVALALVSVNLDYRLAIKLMVGFSLVCSLSLALMAFGFWYRTRSRQAALYCISWLFFLAGVSLYMGNKLGLLPVNFLTEQGLRVGALVEIVFLSFALADRVNQDRAASEAAQKKVIEMQLSMNVELEKQVKSRTQELEYLNHLLLQASITDALTATANRRHFDDMLDKEYRRAAREGTPLALLMVDLDYFKKINDTHGHLVGDMCLQNAARALTACIKRPPDMVARYGGEEFAVLLPNTPLEGARTVAESIRRKIESLTISIPSGQQLRLTVSVGAAAHQPTQRDGHTQLVQEADTALYQAKHAGRNRVMPADTSTAPPSSAGDTAP